jgi:hypothetical protein
VIQLVLVYCLNANAASCIERRPMLESADPMACMVQAQPIAAEYLREHPAYSLLRWRCEMSNRQQRAT